MNKVKSGYVPVLKRNRETLELFKSSAKEIRKLIKEIEHDGKYFRTDNQMIPTISKVVRLMFLDDRQYQFEEAYKLFVALQCMYEQSMAKHPDDASHYAATIIDLDDVIESMDDALGNYHDKCWGFSCDDDEDEDDC